MNRHERTKIVVTSLCRALAKALPLVGAAIDQAIFGTRDALRKAEVESVIHEIEGIVRDQLEPQAPLLSSGAISPEQAANQFCESYQRGVDRFSRLLARLSVRDFCALTVAIESYSEQGAPPPEENEQFERALRSAASAASPSEPEHPIQRCSYQDFLGLVDDLASLKRALHELRTQHEQEFRTRFQTVVESQAVRAVSDYLRRTKHLLYDLSAQHFNNHVAAPWGFALHFPAIFDYAHAGQLSSVNSMLVTNMVDKSQSRFLVLPGSLVRLHKHLARCAEDLLGFGRYSRRSMNLVLPELSARKSNSALSRFSNFVEHRMLRCEDVVDNHDFGSTILGQVLTKLETCRANMSINNALDAQDIDTLLALNRHWRSSGRLWLYVTSAPNVERVLRELWPELYVHKADAYAGRAVPALSLAGAAFYDYMIRCGWERKRMIPETQAWSGITNDASKELSYLIDIVGRVSDVANKLGPDLCRHIEQALRMLQRRLEALGSSWVVNSMDGFGDDVISYWRASFGTQSVPQQVDYSAYRATCDQVLNGILRLLDHLDPLVRLYCLPDVEQTDEEMPPT